MMSGSCGGGVARVPFATEEAALRLPGLQRFPFARLKRLTCLYATILYGNDVYEILSITF